MGQRLTDRYKVTGFTYTGTPAVTAEVTGYPVYRGYTGPEITVVSLLTDDGEIVDNVRVSTEVMDAVKVHDLGGMAEDALWKIADRDLFGRRGHALAELAYRERRQVAARRQPEAAVRGPAAGGCPMSAKSNAQLTAAKRDVTEAWDAKRPEALAPEFWEQSAACEERLADAYHALMLLTDGRVARMALLDAEECRRRLANDARLRAAEEQKAVTR